MPQRLFHIAPREEVERARAAGQYVPAAFSTEGFIHCSHRHQVVKTAARFFRGVQNLVLLEIDAGRVGAQVVEENLEGGEELFPHLYGSLPFTAVLVVHEFPCDEQGFFSLPPDISLAPGVA